MKKNEHKPPRPARRLRAELTQMHLDMQQISGLLARASSQLETNTAELQVIKANAKAIKGFIAARKTTRKRNPLLLESLPPWNPVFLGPCPSSEEALAYVNGYPWTAELLREFHVQAHFAPGY